MVKKKKLLISGFLSLAIAAAGVIGIISSQEVSADRIDQLQQQINELQKKEQEALAVANELSSKAQTLQAELDVISQEKTAIENQIAISKAQYEKLQIEIKQAEENITNNRKALGVTLANMSVEEEITPIERLASSENLSKALDSLEYQSSVKDSLVEKVAEIKKQKKELETKRDEVKKVLNDQEASEKSLQAKINEQNTILEKTKGEEAEYQKYAQEQSAQKAALQTEQANLILQRSRQNSSSGGSRDLGSAGDSYAWGTNWGCVVNQYNYVSNTVDPLGYGCGQCVSYTAWRMWKETGYQPMWWGNANMWPAAARRNGFSTGSTPRAGSIAVMYVGQYGHVAWVESVSGGMMVISQYNWPTASNGWRWGEYSRMEISTSQFHEYIYVK